MAVVVMVVACCCCFCFSGGSIGIGYELIERERRERLGWREKRREGGDSEHSSPQDITDGNSRERRMDG